MRRLAAGIWQIPTTKRDNAFLVEADDGYTLVDVGWGGAPARIEQELTSIGRSLTDIRRVVVTHAHPDHVKGAAELRARTRAPILIHAADAAWLASGRVPSSGRSGALGRALDRIPALHWTPLTADGLLGDGDVIEATEGLRVVHTPGHSPGHIVLVHTPTGTALVGDSVFNRSGLTLGPAALAADPSTRMESLRRIPEPVRVVGFAHGEPLVGDEAEAFHAFVEESASGGEPR